MSERNAGEDTGSRDDLPAEQGGGSEPWEVKPEVANIGSCQSQAAIVTVWKVSAFERECCGDIASLAALLRHSTDVGERRQRLEASPHQQWQSAQSHFPRAE